MTYALCRPQIKDKTPMRYAGSFAFGNLCFGEFHSRAFRFAGDSLIFVQFGLVWWGELIGACTARWR